MSKSRYAILAILIALWVTVFVFLESTVGKLCGQEHIEFWPALMGPSLIGLLGKQIKKAERKFYITAAFGIVVTLVFILLEHLFVPGLGPSIGVLLALFIAIFIIIGGHFFVTAIAGPISFIYFNAATIMTDDIFILTLVRLIVLFVGTFVFLKIEHLLIKLVAPKKPAAPAEAPATEQVEEKAE